ncbi:protein of unknown function [Xenorhabdus bovienii]|uniref:Uncharacterized protein n=1 Tax=Xenorhabdus bovienii TaxID=40576 RepID=A0A0B6X7C5_XENBV|nr:protein of unknown function [Xenorhabdus bovienii]
MKDLGRFYRPSLSFGILFPSGISVMFMTCVTKKELYNAIPFNVTYIKSAMLDMFYYINVLVYGNR